MEKHINKIRKYYPTGYDFKAKLNNKVITFYVLINQDKHYIAYTKKLNTFTTLQITNIVTGCLYPVFHSIYNYDIKGVK